MATFANPNWSQGQQLEAEAGMMAIALKFGAAYETLLHNPPSPEWKQPVLNTLAEWRSFNENLSTVLHEQDSSVIDTIGPLAEQVVEQKQILQELKTVAGTRDNQVSSLNPKSTPSPYVNLLGLQRTFRPGTRTAILWVGVFFGFLTLCVISAMIFMFVTRGIVATPVLTGGARGGRSVSFALPSLSSSLSLSSVVT